MYKAYIFFWVVNLLGLVGLAAFGLIPARLWGIFNFILKNESKNKIKILVVFFVAAFISIWCEIDAVKLLFECFMDFKCGPNRGNMLIHLAFLGVVYIAIELLFFVMKKIYGEYIKKTSGKFRSG